jgi:hypothetical protein
MKFGTWQPIKAEAFLTGITGLKQWEVERAK